MSGVFIKGLKMPENCSDCWFCVDGEYCEAIKEYFHEKPKNCPLIPVETREDALKILAECEEMRWTDGNGN